MPINARPAKRRGRQRAAASRRNGVRARLPRPGRSVESAGRILEKLRGLCLSMPDVSEVEAWGHPNFRVGKKTFAVFEVYRGRPCIAVKAEDGLQQLLIDEVRFFRTPYIGNRGWISAWVDREVDWRLLKDLVKRSYSLNAPRSRPKRSSARARAGRN